MIHGRDTTNDRDLEPLGIALGDEHFAEIYRAVKRNPEASILDIGCGQGTALRELKRDARFSRASLYGMDVQPLGVASKLFTFLQQSIEAPVPEGLKFDLIISVATFPYVSDLAAALKNIARALKPHGKAIIIFEPFYLGPHGVEMLQKPGVTEWNGDLTALTVYPGDGRSIMEGYVMCPLPDLLLTRLYQDRGDLSGQHKFELPAYYTAEDVAVMKLQNPQIGEATEDTVINWAGFSFLRVRTPNPMGPDGAGDPGHRAYRYAAPRVYLLRDEASVYTEGRLAHHLIHEANYPDLRMKKPESRCPADLRNDIIERSKLPKYQNLLIQPAREAQDTCTFYTIAAAGVAIVAAAAAAIFAANR